MDFDIVTGANENDNASESGNESGNENDNASENVTGNESASPIEQIKQIDKKSAELLFSYPKRDTVEVATK